MNLQTAMAARVSPPVRLFRAWLRMVEHMLPSTLFFLVGFCLILWTMRLALDQHGIDVQGYATAVVAALLVGKAVLLTDKLPFMARFDGAPLIQPILFKSAIYWVCVFVVRLIDIMVHYIIEHGTIDGFGFYIVENFRWQRFVAIQVWLMVLFLIYVTLHELNNLFGDGELRRLFFRWRSPQAKLIRRNRIRLLVRLNRLTEAATIDEIGERGSPAHEELVAILRDLTRLPMPKSTQPKPDADNMR